MVATRLQAHTAASQSHMKQWLKPEMRGIMNEQAQTRHNPLWVAFSPALFVLLWSTGFIFAKLGAPYSEPFTFLLLRFVLVAGLFLAAALILSRSWPGRREAMHNVVVGFLIHGVYLGGVFWAIDTGLPSGIAALIVGLQPLITMIFAKWLLGEQPSSRLMTGLALGLFGVGLVLAPKLLASSFGFTPATLGVSFLAVIAMALGTVYQKRFLGRSDPVTGGFWQYFGSIILVALFATTTETMHIDWTRDFIIALVCLVFVLSIGAVSILMILIEMGAIAKVASLFYLVPATASVFAYFLFGETLTLVQLAGMGVVTLAVAIVVTDKTLSRRRPARADRDTA